MNKYIYFVNFGILSLSLVGCINTPPVNQEPIQYYQAPQSSLSSASIIGDRLEGKYFADTEAYVFAVDQQKVANGRKQLNIPLNLSAGEHTLQLWCQRGAFKYSNLIRVNIEASKHYQVGYKLNLHKQQNCYFWIYDLDAKQAIGELVEGIEMGQYADPNRLRPLTHFLEPHPAIQQSITVPIRVVNKMSSH